MKPLIFVVEDDDALQSLYLYSLENEFDCRVFANANELTTALSVQLPDLIILDIMLPEEDGFSILARLKDSKTMTHIPVIMISAKEDEISRVKGLNMGADDFLGKPFGILELVARIKAQLRKIKPPPENLSYKDIIIDESKHQVSISGKVMKMTLKEYHLLRFLCKNAEKVAKREAIFDEVWGGGFMGESRTLDIHIKELRKKLTAAKSKVSINTVRGVGYILQEE
ncbi:MAG: response regulator transcription factor [Lachnospiraceae bacterium]|jgi:two-component system alkaline phosphatase synthesis response regulator PhoP|nr:response regulator transcription factor [Lachnospiraceae bacterium]